MMLLPMILAEASERKIRTMANENLNPKDENIKMPAPDEIDGSDLAEDETPIAGDVRARSRLAGDIFDFFEMLILAACAILFLFTFVARVSVVEGASMNQTLENGDRLIVSDLFYTPSQGDIIVFQDIESGHSSAVVKRVIATGGQTVVLSYGYVDGVNTVTVTVDGVTLDETSYRYYDLSLPSHYRDRYQGTATYVVPEGCVFVMGDNTYNSEDSRGDFGFIEEEKILGRVIFRLMGDDLSDLFSKFGPIN